MTAEQIGRGLDLRRIGHTWRGACPIHGGSSFTLTEKDGKPVFYCWSGCDRGAILAELKSRGLWPESNWTPQQRRNFAAQRQRDERDLVDARLFADAAAVLAVQSLEGMPVNDLERGPLTGLLVALRTDSGMLTEYRAWRTRDPKITAGLVRAGAGHIQRSRGLLDYYLLREGDAHAY